jgi:hypothetical protein
LHIPTKRVCAVVFSGFFSIGKANKCQPSQPAVSIRRHAFLDVPMIFMHLAGLPKSTMLAPKMTNGQFIECPTCLAGTSSCSSFVEHALAS